MAAKIRLELIEPSAEDNAPIPTLSLPVLAALTPEDVEVSFTDDLINPIHLNSGPKDADLVGISCSSKNALRAYEIARTYRGRGTPVVLGGVHPTAVPDEARDHCDSVVVGEAEMLWPRLLEDYRKGQLEPVYRQEGFTPPEDIPAARRSIYDPKQYFRVSPVQATRGCPFLCEFCSVRRFFGGTYRCRPLDQVIEEIRSIPQKYILFVDDNIVGLPRYSRGLMEALVPMKKKWIGQASLAALQNEEDIDLMTKSGCVGLFIGFESISEETLKSIRKYQNKPSRYRQIIHNLHKRGITIWASFMFGLDHDDEGVFERSVQFAVDAKFFSVNFTILTPYPGTAIYERLKSEGRLLNDKWWLLEDQEKHAPHFLPRDMSRERLLEGWRWAWEEYYSCSSIIKRFQWEYPWSMGNKLVYFPFNFIHGHFVRKKILGGERMGWLKAPWKRRSD